MELKVINQQGRAVESLQASDALFGREYNEALVHQLVTAYLANARSGNRAQKGRSEVAKSTRKPWRQKGTGRARAGMASSPLWLVVVRFSHLAQMKTLHKKSTVKCSALVWRLFCRNWCVMSVW